MPLRNANHAGMRWPHQSCREMHQGLMSSSLRGVARDGVDAALSWPPRHRRGGGAVRTASKSKKKPATTSSDGDDARRRRETATDPQTPEIQDTELHEHVFRFYISMRDASLVAVAQRQSRNPSYCDHNRFRAAPRMAI